MRTPFLNIVAFVTFVFAKISGIIGVALGFTEYRILGGWLLGLAGLFLLATVIICLMQMGRQNKQDEADTDAVDRMFRDGRLQERLKQLKLQ